MALGRLRASDLRQKLDIQAPTLTPDGGGGKTKTWNNVAEGVRAKIEPLNGGEAFGQGIERMTQFYRIRMRYRVGVSAALRMMWKGTALNIRTCADPDGRGRELLITAESGVGEP